MPRWLTIAIAFTLAVVATVMGFLQSVLHHDLQPVPLSLWFPVVVITGSREMAMVGWALVHYPLFALAFVLGVRRWSPRKVLLVLVSVYALLAGLALVIVKSVYGNPST